MGSKMALRNLLICNIIWIIIAMIAFIYYYHNMKHIKSQRDAYKCSSELYNDCVKIQAEIIFYRYDRALEMIGKLPNSNKNDLTWIMVSLMQFWYSVGTCNYTPNISPNSSKNISSDLLYKSLYVALDYDISTSNSMNVSNLTNTISIFSEKKKQLDAYSLIASMVRKKDIEISDELYSQIPLLFKSADINSLSDLRKISMFMSQKKYKEIIEIREKELPELKKDLNYREQVILASEVASYAALGNYKISYDLGKNYLENGYITDKNARNAINILLRSVERKLYFPPQKNIIRF